MLCLSYIQLLSREFNGKGFPLVLFSFCSLGNYSGGLRGNAHGLGGGGVSPFVAVVCFDFFLSFPRYLFLLCPDGFFEKMLEPSSLF